MDIEKAAAMTKGQRYALRKKGVNVHKFKPGVKVREFESLINKTDKCWLWLGGHNSYGYGRYKSGKDGLAHRYMWVTLNGVIPDGMVVMHSCDTPSCVNPDHLSLGKNKDNVADKVSKGRQAKGESIAGSKLKESDVLAIRKEYKFRVRTYSFLAKKYGVSKDLVQKVVRRIYWRHCA